MKRLSILNMTTRSKSRFLPNFHQIKEAMCKLPEASNYEKDDHYEATIIVEDKVHKICFVKMEIQKGSQLVSRWVYEGKFLIREQDIDGLEF